MKWISIFLFAAVLCLQADAQTISYYDITLPGYPPRGILEAPGGINEALQICGPNFNFSHSTAYLWQDGIKEDVPFPIGMMLLASHAHDINNNGCIVGGKTGDNDSARLWDGTSLTTLGTLGGDCSIAYAINENDQVAGRSRINQTDTHPFIWQDGTMTDLGTLGGTYGEAFAINESGIVVGHCRNAQADSHAFIWQGGTITDLGTLGGPASAAFDINDANEVVGYAEIENGYQHACKWKNGQVTDLGTLGGNQSQAFAINNNGIIIGWAETSTGYRPLVAWVGEQIVRLQSLIDTDSGWELMLSYGQESFPWFRLTESGAIMGKGFVNGFRQPFLMIPRDRPFLLADTNKDQQVDMTDFSVFSKEWMN